MSASAKPNIPMLQRGHPSANGLVSAWAFYENSDKTVYDLSGNVADILIINIGDTTWSGGQFGSVFTLDSIPQSWSVPNSTTVMPVFTTQLTIAFWFLELAGNSTIGMGRWDVPTNNRSYLLLAQGSTLRFSVSTNGIVENTVSNTPTGFDGTIWHHLAGTFEAGKNLFLYLDGKQIATAILLSASPLFNSTVDFQSNNVINGGLVPSFGSYDDIRLYNCVLSQPEIAQIIADPWSVYKPRQKSYLFRKHLLPITGVGG